MLVSDLLETKDGRIHSIGAAASLATAAGIMSAANIGALIVEGPTGELIGLVSERDVTAALAQFAGEADRKLVGQTMTVDPATTTADATLMTVMRTMTNRRARHVPVVEGGRVIGVLSIGDVLKCRLEEKIYENQVLQDIARWPRAA